MHSAYDFGIIKVLRKQRDMTLMDLAEHSGLTYPTVETIEKNKGVPSLKSLDSIAGVFGLTSSKLLLLAEKRLVQRRKATRVEGVVYSNGMEGIDKCKVAFYDKAKIFRVSVVEGDLIDVVKMHEDCNEFCYVISGCIELRVENSVYRLESDDTVLFDGVLEHTYRGIKDGEFITVHIPKEINVIEALLQSSGSQEFSAL